MQKYWIIVSVAVLVCGLASPGAANPSGDVTAAVNKANKAGSWDFVATSYKLGKETGVVEPPSYAFAAIEGGPNTLITDGKQYIDYHDGNGWVESRYHGTMSILFIIPPVYGPLSSDSVVYAGWKPLPGGKPAKLYHIVSPKGAVDLYIGNDGYPYRLVTSEGSVDYSNFGRSAPKIKPH
jgi:hypothetical protein